MMTMDKALPRETLQEILAISPLSAFNALARSCALMRDLAAAIAVRYADHAADTVCDEDTWFSSAICNLPNGVHHGLSIVVERHCVEIEVNYDRGQIVGLCNMERTQLVKEGRETFRPDGFVRLGERECVAYSKRSRLSLTKTELGLHELAITITGSLGEVQFVVDDNVSPPKWDIDSIDDHIMAEAWFEQYMIDTPLRHGTFGLPSWWFDERNGRNEFMRSHLPGLFCARAIVESAGR